MRLILDVLWHCYLILDCKLDEFDRKLCENNIGFSINIDPETKILSCCRSFHHCLYKKWSKWQLLMQQATNILLKCLHMHFSEYLQHYMLHPCHFAIFRSQMYQCSCLNDVYIYIYVCVCIYIYIYIYIYILGTLFVTIVSEKASSHIGHQFIT